MAILLSFLCIKNINNSIYLVIIFCFLGFFGAYTLVLLSHYRALFHEKIIGKVLTTANLFNFFGVFLIQWLTGFIIFNLTERYNISIETSFNIAFLMVIICLIFSTLLYLKTDEI
jgi:hypothetical protein